MKRKTENTTGRRSLLVLAVAIALLTVPLLADERPEEKPWTLRGAGVWIDGGFEGSAHASSRGAEFEGDYGAGFNVALEYRVNKRLGLEIGNLIGGVATTRNQVYNGRVSSDSSDLGFSTLMLGLNVHLLPSESIQLYVSPIIGYVWFSDINYDGYGHGHDGSNVRVGNEFAWGGGLGIDIPIAKSAWSVSIIAKYLDTSIETSKRDPNSPIDTSFDPFVIGVGFGFNF